MITAMAKNTQPKILFPGYIQDFPSYGFLFCFFFCLVVVVLNFLKGKYISMPVLHHSFYFC